MQRIRSSPPHPRLREFVRAYAQREVFPGDDASPQLIPASLEQILQFDFAEPLLLKLNGGGDVHSDRVNVVGPHTFAPGCIHFPGRVQTFGIFFQPLGLWQVLGIPACELTDRFYEGQELLGPAVNDLWHRMAEQPAFEARVQIIEAFLFQQVCQRVVETPIMAYAKHIFHHRGVLRIGRLAGRSALSLRQFERRFQAETGISPKRFARISRFQTSLDAKLVSPARPWLDIAHSFGYHDHMHMVRDFHSLAGHSPTALLAQLGDTRPAALAAAGSEA